MALLLAFRTNRGFERYNSGAQVWINLGSQLRNAAHHIWCFPTQTQEAHDEKLSILKLLYAVAIATKYSLRGHDPLHFDEVQSLLPKPDSHHDSATASNSTLAFKTVNTCHSFCGDGLESEAKRIPRKPTRPSTATIGGLRRGSVINAPLDMLYKAASYVKRLKRSGAIEQDDSGPAVVALNACDRLCYKFEQLLYVPVPKSYDVHIKQILILYFLSLPFQLVRQHGWATVFVSFVGA
ncbi:hypothetical protein BC829DRAFT_442107 [Chytridium lagenaria]|nr:hypothetical protein BC829DRAFT_442107 [Chytridium lagenaria]